MSDDVRTYRGRNLAEILPRIREELGDDAVVLRRREGLAGGVGGFFAKAFIEVEARAGAPRIDVRDDDVAEPAPPAPPVARPGSATDMADALAAFAAPTAPGDPFAAFAAPGGSADPFAAFAAPAAEQPATPAPTAPVIAAEPVASAVEEGAPAPSSGFARLLADAYARGFGAPDEAPAEPARDTAAAERFLADLAPAAAPQPSAAERFLADLAAAAPDPVPAPEAVPSVDAFLADVLPGAGAATTATAARPAATHVVPDYVPRELEAQTFPALAAAENRATAGAAPAQADQVHAQSVHRTKAAEAAEAALVAGGCSPAFAADVVAEATAHGLPFATPRSLRRLVREALVRRLPAAPPRGAHAVVALVGAAGSGRTTAAGRLAAAYAAGSDLEARAIALRAPDGGAELAALAPGCAVAAASASEAAAVVTAAGPRALVVLDVPPVAARDAAAVQALRRELRTAGATEVHLVLPATTGAAAARALLAATKPLGPTAVLVTHAEDAAGAGALLEIAATEGLPLVWQSTSGALGPADPAALAGELLR